MKKVLIIGGGFAGLAALKALSRQKGFSLSLIDRKETFDFLPLLPDLIGRGIKPQALTCRLGDLLKSKGADFINDEVVSLDLEKRSAFLSRGSLDFDYLIAASGSQTNFYGNKNIETSACKLDAVTDAVSLLKRLKENDFSNFIVAGGGYTGIEVASALRVFLRRSRRSARIIIVERSPAILGPLPPWMKEYVNTNLKGLKIEVYLNSSLERIEGGKTFLSQNRSFEESMVIWTAGVETSGYLQGLKVEKNPQGRVRVDEFMSFSEGCFAAGDAAWFLRGKGALRMAVQFSIAEGYTAGLNVIRSSQGKKLKLLRPLDLGMIIPMANNFSCGNVLGVDLKGRLPTLLHFIMCIYRACGITNKREIIINLLQGGRK